MTQVIVYTNATGNVSICIPTGEIPIETVLTKDCPDGAVIVDDSVLPKGDDANYMDAWVLKKGIVTVDAVKKSAIIANQNLKTEIKTSALNKLEALGLTADEIKAIVG